MQTHFHTSFVVFFFVSFFVLSFSQWELDTFEDIGRHLSEALISWKLQLLIHSLKVASSCQGKFACHIQRTIFHTLVFTCNSFDTQNHLLTSALLTELSAEAMGVVHHLL